MCSFHISLLIQLFLKFKSVNPLYKYGRWLIGRLRCANFFSQISKKVTILMLSSTSLDIVSLCLSCASFSLLILKRPSSLSKPFSRYNYHDKLLLLLITAAILMQCLNIVNSSVNLAGAYLSSAIMVGVTFKEEWVMSPLMVSVCCLMMFQVACKPPPHLQILSSFQGTHIKKISDEYSF